ncbi:MAG: Ig-like domain-containing protein [Spirochaetes bacterium]|nr:Ig-like domain-containing protein [Spirochaetota bacterium]
MRQGTGGIARTFAAAAVVAAVAVSCPNPIDRDLLLVVEDGIVPALVITTPVPYSYYHGNVTVEGTVTDSSRRTGDGEGRLQTLSFSVNDYSPLDLTVTFAEDGSATITPADPSWDPSFVWNAATGSFKFSFPSENLQGPKILTFVARDVNENESRQQVALQAYPDGPHLQLESPVDFSVYDMEVTIKGTVTDTPAPDDDTADEVRRLEWQIVGKPPHELVIGGTPPSDGIYRSGTFTFDLSTGVFEDSYDSSADSGTIYLKVSAWNVNNSTYTTVQLRFNGTGPAINLAPEVPGHNPSEYSSNVTPAITIDGTVDTTNLATMRYKVIQNPGTPLGGFFSPDPGTDEFSFTFLTTTLAGNLSVEVYAKDLRGIESMVEHPIYDDTNAPLSPSVSGPVSPTNDSTPTWTWDTPASTADFQLSFDSSTGPWTATVATSWTPAGSLADGSHSLYVCARDAVENASSAGSYTLVVDTIPPAAPTVSGPASPTNDSTPTWTWNTPTGTVEFRRSLDSATGPWTPMMMAFEWTPVTDVAEGSHTLYVQARDAAGNWSVSGSYALTVDITPPAAPTVSGPASPTNDKKPTWTWNTPGDATGFRRSLDDPDPPSWTTTTATSWTPSANLGEGDHTLYVQARDAAGNWSSSGSFSVTVDTTPPAAPNVDGPTNPCHQSMPTWTWNTPADTVGFQYSLDNSGGPWEPTTATSYTPLLPLDDGTHTLYVQAQDAAGNWSDSGWYTVNIE